MSTYTLRAANRIGSEARKIIDKLTSSLKEDVEINIYSNNPYQDLLNYKVEFDTNVRTIEQLELALARLRITVGNTNQTSGIDALLGEDAGLVRIQNLFERLINRKQNRTGDEELAKLVASAIKRNEDTTDYYGRNPNHVTANVAGVELRAELTESLKSVKIRRQKISDTLLTLNSTVKVEINPADIEIFRTNGVIFID